MLYTRVCETRAKSSVSQTLSILAKQSAMELALISLTSKLAIMSKIGLPPKGATSLKRTFKPLKEDKKRSWTNSLIGNTFLFEV